MKYQKNNDNNLCLIKEKIYNAETVSNHIENKKQIEFFQESKSQLLFNGNFSFIEKSNKNSFFVIQQNIKMVKQQLSSKNKFK